MNTHSPIHVLTGLNRATLAVVLTFILVSSMPLRALAAEVLGKDSDPYALTLLEWSLGDNNWAVRVAVCKALGERGNDATIAKLQPLLNDDHHAVRYMAAASVVKLSLKGPSTAAR